MNSGEVWRINLDPTIGAEIKKTRPCVIVNRQSIGKLPLKIVVPLTHWREEFANAPWLIQVHPTKTNGLTKPSAADTFQVRSVSERRLVDRIGELSKETMAKVRAGLRLSLDLD